MKPDKQETGHTGRGIYALEEVAVTLLGLAILGAMLLGSASALRPIKHPYPQPVPWPDGSVPVRTP